jgi:hypothetical protein
MLPHPDERIAVVHLLLGEDLISRLAGDRGQSSFRRALFYSFHGGGEV